jgi:hypothetical protein
MLRSYDVSPSERDGSEHRTEPMERTMTKDEDDRRDTRTSNWTLATGTLPGRRDIEAVTAAAVHPTAEQSRS